ncbi:hypothetical protein ACPRNU_01915 [Chromobacterium vaccinii]|uniref:hypothetical protein n=1 Tax=Chromobacterium vaccinii TaxID=1108595 RepID=UPI003C74AC2C
MDKKPWMPVTFTIILTLIGKATYDLVIEDVKNNLIPKGWVAGAFLTIWNWLHETLVVTRGWWYLYNFLLIASVVAATIWGVKFIGEFNELIEANKLLEDEKNKLKEDAGKKMELENTIQALEKEIKSTQANEGVSFDKLHPTEQAVLLSIAKMKNEGVEYIREKWIYESLSGKASRLQAENAMTQLTIKKVLRYYYSNGDRCCALTGDGLNILAQAETH